MTFLRKGVFWLALAIVAGGLASAQGPGTNEGKSLGEIARELRAKKQVPAAAPTRRPAPSPVFRAWARSSPSTPGKFAGKPDNVKTTLAAITPVLPDSAADDAPQVAAAPLVVAKAASPK